MAKSDSIETAEATTQTFPAISSKRPSTWHVFLMHFILPMSIILVVSNSNDIFDSIVSLPSLVLQNHHRGSGTQTTSPTTEPTSLPQVEDATSPSSLGSQFKKEVDSAIERKLKKNIEPSMSTTENIHKSRLQQNLQEKKKKSREHNIQKKQKRQPGQNSEGRPTSPQSSPMYKQMEANIAKLRQSFKLAQRSDESDYSPRKEYLAAIKFANYLKQRDATIHDGGTYQMECIEVYTRACQLLEQEWREKIANGEDARSTSSDKTDVEAAEAYNGLTAEMFLDDEQKSIEGLLCSTYSHLGKVYFMANMFERSVQSYEECLSYDPNYLDALTYRAQANIILGHYAEAGRDYKRVLEMDEGRLFVDAVTGFAKVLSAKEDAVEGGWDFLVKLLEEEMPQQQEKYKLSFDSNNQVGMKHYADSLKRMCLAMFTYHDVKTKNVSSAWSYLSKGNQYKMSRVAPFDANMEKARVFQVKQVFNPGFFPKGIGSNTRTPIFIIGFVRSGSTLLERILDAHPLIVGTGEDSVFNGRLDSIRNSIVEASMSGDLRVLHEVVKKQADDVVVDMTKRWEIIDANTHSEDVGDALDRPTPTRFTDKMLTNYMNVGFIHLLFPKALILHVAREPMDTIFSAFKHDFPPGGLDYTSDFAGLAQLYHSYRDVMEHWDSVLPGRVTHIRYEDMVTDLQNIAPKIIDAAGVPWDPTVLDFHKKKHAVNTLSTTQVRKGVYSHHLKGWKRYEEFLEPLLKLVGNRAKYDLVTTLPGYEKVVST